MFMFDIYVSWWEGNNFGLFPLKYVGFLTERLG